MLGSLLYVLEKWISLFLDTCLVHITFRYTEYPAGSAAEAILFSEMLMTLVPVLFLACWEQLIVLELIVLEGTWRVQNTSGKIILPK